MLSKPAAKLHLPLTGRVSLVLLGEQMSDRCFRHAALRCISKSRASTSIDIDALFESRSVTRSSCMSSIQDEKRRRHRVGEKGGWSGVDELSPVVRVSSSSAATCASIDLYISPQDAPHHLLACCSSRSSSVLLRSGSAAPGRFLEMDPHVVQFQPKFLYGAALREQWLHRPTHPRR